MVAIWEITFFFSFLFFKVDLQGERENTYYHSFDFQHLPHPFLLSDLLVLKRILVDPLQSSTVLLALLKIL
jgi:hypothetical protein